MTFNSACLHVYLVADYRDQPVDDFITRILAAVSGGVTLVQLRAKQTDDATMLHLAQRLQASLPVPLIINDRIAVAQAIGAGVHLGQDDTTPTAARALLGKDTIIGHTVRNPAQAKIAQQLWQQGALDYIGCGAIYPSATKTTGTEVIGLAGLQAVQAVFHGPIVAIGGLTHTTAPTVRDTGVAGIAVSSAIMGVADPAAAALSLAK